MLRWKVVEKSSQKPVCKYMLIPLFGHIRQFIYGPALSVFSLAAVETHHMPNLDRNPANQNARTAHLKRVAGFGATAAAALRKCFAHAATAIVQVACERAVRTRGDSDLAQRYDGGNGLI